MLDGTFCVVCYFLNTLFLLFFAGEALGASEAPILFRFNLEKYNWYFPFRFLTAIDLFYFLFQVSKH